MAVAIFVIAIVVMIIMMMMNTATTTRRIIVLGLIVTVVEMFSVKLETSVRFLPSSKHVYTFRTKQ